MMGYNTAENVFAENVPGYAAGNTWGSPEQAAGILTMLMQGGMPGPTRGGMPLDMSLGMNPAQVMRPNPFGLGPDYNNAPMLNQPRKPTMLDQAGASQAYQPPLDELAGALNPHQFATRPPEASAFLDWLGQFLPRGTDDN